MLKLAVAAVLRTLRSRKGLTQDNLVDATSRTYLTTLEQGKASISLDKLQSVSLALGISPLSFLALALSKTQDSSPLALLELAHQEIERFAQSGGLEELDAQILGGNLSPRFAGKPVDREKLSKVLQCKAEGMTQKMVSEKLGIPKQTVNDLWKRVLD